MALKTLNSIGGFGVGDDGNIVIYANSDISGNIIVANVSVNTLDLNVTGIANLGIVGNVKIAGGTEGQSIVTDGNGTLSFQTLNPTGAMMPYYIAEGETYLVPTNKQGLFSIPITIDGTLEVTGILVQV
jgi:hypothetical protein